MTINIFNIILGIFLFVYSFKNRHTIIIPCKYNYKIIDEFKEIYIKVQNFICFSLSIILITIGILGVIYKYPINSAYIFLVMLFLPNILLKKYTKK